MYECFTLDGYNKAQYHGYMDRQCLIHLASLIRYYCLTSSTTAGSGHPTSSLSAVDLMTTLFFKYLRYDTSNPQNPVNDRVIFSKGHASPLFYALYAAAGVIPEAELHTFRKFQSRLEGHPTPRFPFTEAATGSLGQGLSLGVGEAWAIRTQFQNEEADSWLHVPQVYVLLGDGELAEGQQWEALAHAATLKLHNLVAIVDINRLGQSEPTQLEHNVVVYRRRFEAFGWNAIVIDGHDFAEIDAAFEKALAYTSGPVAILAKTVKGKGVPFLEDKLGWHGKALTPGECEAAVRELGPVNLNLRGTIQARDQSHTQQIATGDNTPYIPTKYEFAAKVSTRKAVGTALAQLGEIYPHLVVLDGDVQNSTYTDAFAKAFPDRFIQCYIAEQHMVTMAAGIAKRGYRAALSSFACFLTRAHDQFRMAALSDIPLVVCGTHAGVVTGEDGASQMGLEDIALFRSLPGSVVVYPADHYAAETLTATVFAESTGIGYVRATRESTLGVYARDTQFPIGGSHLFPAKVGKPKVTVVAAGYTLHEALAAQKKVAEDGIPVQVLDCYSVKPIDSGAIQLAAAQTAILVVEDHYPEGGLGEAVLSAIKGKTVAFEHLAVRKIPISGKPEELLAYAEIDHTAIEQHIRKLFKLNPEKLK